MSSVLIIWDHPLHLLSLGAASDIHMNANKQHKESEASAQKNSTS